jgi:multiple sugar transport system permease protein
MEGMRDLKSRSSGAAVDTAAPYPSIRHRSVLQRAFGRQPEGLLFVAPAIILFALVGIVPILVSAGLSLFKWDGLSDPKFVGIQNFESFLWGDTNVRTLFWEALSHNAFLGVVVTGSTLIIALPVASALNSIRRLKGLFRTTLLLPLVTAGIAVYFTWSFLYSPFGPLNAVLENIGLGALAPPRGWLSDPVMALPSLAVVLVWTSLPLAVLLYLAGLQTINRDLFEAASLDGANWVQRLRHVSWPILRPITLIIVTLNLVSILQSYELVYLMTNGGPTNHTTVVGLLAFNLAFGTIGGSSSQLGIASAIGWSMFVVLAALTWFLSRVLRSRFQS